MTSIVELNGEDLSWIYPPNEITGERDEGFMIGKTTGIDEVVRGWAKYEGKAHRVDHVSCMDEIPRTTQTRENRAELSI